jgi:hypothetical protein
MCSAPLFYYSTRLIFAVVCAVSDSVDFFSRYVYFDVYTGLSSLDLRLNVKSSGTGFDPPGARDGSTLQESSAGHHNPREVIELASSLVSILMLQCQGLKWRYWRFGQRMRTALIIMICDHAEESRYKSQLFSTSTWLFFFQLSCEVMSQNLTRTRALKAGLEIP